MHIPLGITVTAVTSSAMSQLGAVSQRLQHLGGSPATIAAQGFSRFEHAGVMAARNVEDGLIAAERAWWKLGGAFGVPMSLAGIVGAVSGIRSLKGAVIDANVAMETTQARMGAMLRDWNDSKDSARLKAASVSGFVERYAGTTPFDQQGVTEAAVLATMYTKDQGGVEAATKLSAKLAAYKGTNDIAWAAQSLQSAMNGDTSSLRMSFGINVSQEQLQQQAMMSGYGNTMRGRFEAIKRMIEMRAGTDDQIVQDLARTGLGASNVLQDSFAVPLRQLSEPAYKEGVAALVRFNESMSTFQESSQFKAFMTAGKELAGDVGKRIGAGVDFLADNLERIPGILARYGPAIMTVGKVAAGIAALGASSLALHGTMLLAQSSVGVFTRFLHPMLLLVGNPLLVGGLLALSAVMWPTAKSLEVGGASLDAWVGKAEKWSAQKDWTAMFLSVPAALKRALGDVQGMLQGEQSLDQMLTSWVGAESLPARLLNIVRPIGQGLVNAVRISVTGAREEAQGALTDFAARQPGLTRALEASGGAYAHASGLISQGWALLGRAAEQSSPALERAAGAVDALLPEGVDRQSQLTGLGMGLGLMAASLLKLALVGPGLSFLPAIGTAITGLAGTVGLPALAAGLAVTGAVLYPFVRDLQVGGQSLDTWIARLGKLSSSVAWDKIFGTPLRYVRSALDFLTGKALTAEVDIALWWSNLLAPDSFISRIGAIIDPVWQGLLQALDDAFPELEGFFERNFGKIGEDLKNVFTTVVNVVGPILEGILSTIQDVATALKPIIGELVRFVAAIASTAWGAVERAFEWMAKVTGNPNTQEALESLAKNLSGLAVGGAVAVGAVRAAPVVSSALGGLGAAGGWMAANPAVAGGMLAVAALTITAATAKIYMNKQEENLNRALPWMLVSTTPKADGTGVGLTQTMQALSTNAQVTNQYNMRGGAGVLGVIGALLGKNVVGEYANDARYTGSKRVDLLNAGYVGTQLGSSINSQMSALSMRTDLSKDATRAMADATAAREKLAAMYLKFENTGILDWKEFGRVSDVMMRSLGALGNMGYLQDIFPTNLTDPTLFTKGKEYVPPAFETPRGPGSGGGSNEVQVTGVGPGSGGGSAAPVIGDIIVHVHRSDASPEDIGAEVRMQVQIALSQALNGGY